MSKMSELDMSVTDLASIVVENTIAWLSEGEPIPDMVAFVVIEATRCAFVPAPDDAPYIIGHAVSLALSQLQRVADDVAAPHAVH